MTALNEGMHSSLARILAIAATAAALAGCAAPGTARPKPDPVPATSSSSAPVTSSAASSSNSSPAAEATSITPSVPVSTPPSQEPGTGAFPPELVLTDIKDAAATTVTIGKVTVQIPGGYTQTNTDPATYTGTGPETGSTGTITLATTASTGGTATDQLAAVADAARIGDVTIPGSAGSAMSESVTSGITTWRLLVLPSDGTAVTITIAGPRTSFDDLMLYQSLCSIQVAA